MAPSLPPGEEGSTQSSGHPAWSLSRKERGTSNQIRMGAQTNGTCSCGATASRASQHQKANARARAAKSEDTANRTPNKEKQVTPFQLSKFLSHSVIVLSILIFSANLTITSAFTSNNNHIIYDNIGSLATRVSHIHVAIPLNISALHLQIQMFLNYIQPLLTIDDHKPNPTPAEIDQRNFQKIISSTVMFSFQKLSDLQEKLNFIEDILPSDGHLDIKHRNKRFLTFLLPILMRDHMRHLDHETVTKTSELYQKMNNFENAEAEILALHARIKTLRNPAITDLPDLLPPTWNVTTIQNLNKHSTNDTVSRDKRQVLALAALASGIVGTFLGLFNSAEIAAISSHLDSVASKQNMLVKISEKHEQHINDLANDLMSLTSQLEAFIKFNPTLLYARLEFQLTAITNRVEALMDTLQQLQHHKLSMKLLDFQQLAAMHKDVMASAETLDTVPLPHNLQDYFQLEASYIKTGKDILILLHVPCSASDNLLTIYKYIPFPFPIMPSLSNFNFSTSISTIQDLINLEHSFTNKTEYEGISFKSESDLIAIGKKIGNRNQYLLLSSADLDACYQRSHTYICEKHQVIRSDLEGSCLGALYIQHPEGVKENCQIRRKPLRETVYQLTATEHLVFSPQPLTTEISCRNGTHFPLKVRATTRITIPEGCTTQLVNHTIQSDFSLRIAPESLHFEWEFNPASLPDSAQLIQGARHIGHQLAMVRQHLKTMLDNQTSHEVFADMMVTHISSPRLLSILIWSCLIFLGLALVMTIVIWYRGKASRSKLQQRQPECYQLVPSAPPLLADVRTQSIWAKQPANP